jgi:hypothetical protein
MQARQRKSSQERNKNRVFLEIVTGNRDEYGQLPKRGDICWIRYYRNGRRFEERAGTES